MSRPARPPAAEGPRPTRGTPDGTRERLVLAAARRFNEVGYWGTDTNDIARAAGYSPGTFYKHFADKRAAFLAAHAWWAREVWAGVARSLGCAAPEGAPERVVAGVVTLHRSWAVFRASLRQLVVSDPEVRQAFVAQRREQLEWLRALEAGQSGPRCRTDAERLALLLLVERVADALADGEAAGLGVDEGDLECELVRRVGEHLAGGLPS